MKELIKPVLNFDELTKLQWSSLLGTPDKLDALKIELAENLHLDPIYTAKETPDRQAIYWGKENNDWSVAQLIKLEGKTDLELNLTIKNALLGSVDALVIDLDRKDKINWATLFEGVYLQMIQIELLNDSNINSDELDDFIGQYIKGNNLNKKDINILSSYNSNFVFEKNEIVIREKNILDGLINFRQNLLALFKVEKTENILIKIEARNDFFEQILIQRLIKLIVYKEAIDSFGTLKSFPQICVNVGSETKQHEALIELTTKTLSAVLGTCDRILIQDNIGLIENKQSETDSRIAKNIQHLLKMENFISEHNDPCAGAYWIETATEKIFQKIY